MADTGESEELKNQDPAFLNDVLVCVQQYGWLIVIAVVIVLYIKNKVQPSISKMKQQAQDARDKKIDPDVAEGRLMAMEAARRRLQEEHDKQAAEYAEKQRIKEEEKRKAKIEDWDNHQQGKGYRSKVKPKEEEQTHTGLLNKKPKQKLRDSDYSPLGGSGGDSCAWRPGRRSGGGGGG